LVCFWGALWASPQTPQPKERQPAWAFGAFGTLRGGTAKSLAPFKKKYIK